MVSLKFKIILLVFSVLVLLAISVPGVKAVYLSSGWGCGPYTCGCKNIFGAWACKVTCSSPSCGARCYCGPFEAFCQVWNCGTSYYEYRSVCSGSYVLYQQRLISGLCSGEVSCYTSYGSWTTYSQTYCGTSYYQYRSVCSGSNVLYQQRLISRGCSGGSCYSSYGSWTTYSPSYYEYRSVCSGSNVLYQQRLISKGCSGGSCYTSTGSWTTYSQTNCGTSYYEYRCSTDGYYVERRLISEGCSGGSCYSSTGSWTNYQDCGIDSCSSWGDNYCEDNDVYHSRICYDRGCANESCYENSSTDEEKVQECGLSTWLDEYRCSGDWTQKKKINRGCSGSSCYEITEWENDQNCSLICYPGVLNEGCQGGTYTCNDGTCGFPLQSCSPSQYTDSGIACECDVEEGTMIKACNGSGSCLDVEEVCDVDCGADLVCQGLKPGDEYPGDPSKICCKGEKKEMPLPKWYEVSP